MSQEPKSHPSEEPGPTQATDSTTPSASEPRAEPPKRSVWLLLGWGCFALAFGWALWQSIAKRWLCDDAFISFRYASHWLAGHGLVFNPGEYVEGYTNFLWTMWLAIGGWLGASMESWSLIWGIVSYCGVLILLVLWSWRWQRRRGDRASGWLPLAAILAACFPELHIYATSGLETSAVMFWSILGFYLVTQVESRRDAVVAGVVFILAAMTRPDGAILPLLATLFLWWRFRTRGGIVAAYALTGLLLGGAFVGWRLWYYGDLLPNTYYAKYSVGSRFSQGLFFAWLFLKQYWTVGVGLLGWCLWGSWLRLRRPSDNVASQAPASSDDRANDEQTPASLAIAELWLAGGFVLVFGLYIVRMGGGFMYGRLLLPMVPCALMLLDALWQRASWGEADDASQRRRWVGGGLAAVVIMAQLLTPHPLPDRRIRRGVVNEYVFYKLSGRGPALDRIGRKMRPYLQGLDVQLAFLGSQVRVIHNARVKVAVEVEVGLTNRWLARQPGRTSDRIGHGKMAPASYLLQTRKIELLMASPGIAAETFGLHRKIPMVSVFLGAFPVLLLRWDPVVITKLKRHRIRVPDFPGQLDALLKKAPTDTCQQARGFVAKLERFYFGPAGDDVRRKAFVARVATLCHKRPASPGRQPVPVRRVPASRSPTR